MGNNHDRYFDKSKRKVLLLGVSNAGKTRTLPPLLSPLELACTLSRKDTPITKQDLDIVDIQYKKTKLCIFVHQPISTHFRTSAATRTSESSGARTSWARRA